MHEGEGVSRTLYTVHRAGDSTLVNVVLVKRFESLVEERSKYCALGPTRFLGIAERRILDFDHEVHL